MTFDRFKKVWADSLIVGMAIMGVLYLGSYIYSFSGNTQNHCYLDENQGLFSQMVSSVSGLVIAQDQEPEGDKYCERPDPNGDPNVGGTDPNRIGCTCMRKCDPNTGQPTENYEEGKRCKVHCKPDHCKCPNLCDS
ncbi:MAG: hypothetical protein A3C61_01445 [Candidatus Yanofskybacteria bacterium RIFCSPHIGHO2_02_FULL_39_10]|uniref:Uncharacterized protein n=1 Tax=Candidatus Yanofskybacteria bacterium RIFCSPHIGHO2_02_FULL_39_10 TaxID=1802674 RepID=A0A1F8F6M0_9BACT|nr:MAG: hypothetical protein A3C61_01445 [Candidatus Yanofskybacteria bacterium RIFCSPHIGHO2_02_FULL_39_10]